MRVPPSVSVVMPTFNAAQFVGAAVESILSQTFTDFEFIIVDDCSSDGSSELLREYASRDTRIRLFRNDRNLDFVRSRNRGIGEARGALIANMDSDDIALPDRLALQHAFMCAHPDVGVCGAAILLIDERGRDLGVRHYRCDDAGLRNRFFVFNPFAHPITMVRKAVLDVVGLYNPDYILADDLDLWFRIGVKYKLANLDRPLLKYRVHPGSATGSRLQSMQSAVLRVRQIARREYGYRASLTGRLAALAARCSEIVPAQQRIAMFNWMRSRLL